uniref:NADH-ubiquinone oxidoreductase chain 5 n=1 Tax=Chytriomyces confervae TaxID=246404 RepID=A0A4P8NQG6_9FUNG|nr:NADH dehydrogenase subunit 5 [Chytriomyces confervae]QCQ69061.1 NADH dehydrogenase subunit 5 [Chytriomyces confervae]
MARNRARSQGKVTGPQVKDTQIAGTPASLVQVATFQGPTTHVPRIHVASIQITGAGYGHTIIIPVYLSIILLPLLGGLLAVNRLCGVLWGPILSTVCIFISAILGTLAFIETGLSEAPVYINLGHWFESGYLNVEWSLVFDSLTGSMLLPVLYISALVQLYSLSYMEGDPHRSRFFSYLSLFSFAMLILITGENLLVLFVGWEGVGLVSYLLVNFWHTRLAANFASMKAFLVNRVGDMGLIWGLLLAIALFGDLSFASLFSMASYINGDLLTIFVICLVIGATAKSGQFGLSVWLQNAMEGPTPVSALLHSATMVTAGVYLLMRHSPLIEYSSTGLMVIALLGGLSALLGAAGGLLENDMKRVIAFSTTSQLGYMIVCIGISQHSIALFHLLNHACFKALLFLSAGSVIHAVGDIQDLRKMGGLMLLLPRTYGIMLLASLSLMAFPFMTGFYSKDFLLELILVPRNSTSAMAYILALVAAVLSATYSARLLILAFISRPNYPRVVTPLIGEPSLLMTIPMLVLAVGSILFGYLTHDLFLGLGNTFYQQVIFIHPNHLALLDASLATNPVPFLGYLPVLTLLLLVTLWPSNAPKVEGSPLDSMTKVSQGATARISASDVSLVASSPSTGFTLPMYTGMLSHFNVINHWIIKSTLNLSVTYSRSIDMGILNLCGPHGLHRMFNYLSFLVEQFSTGFVLHYALMVIVTLVTVLPFVW